MMATGAQADVVEVGYFGPGQFIPCDELSAGMVGYITASIKMSGIHAWVTRSQMLQTHAASHFRAIRR